MSLEIKMEMLGMEVMRLKDLERHNKHEELAAEYSIRVDPESHSGLIVYGRFGSRWECNPGLRPIVRKLLTRLGCWPDHCTHGVQIGNWCEACRAEQAEAASDPENQ